MMKILGYEEHKAITLKSLAQEINLDRIGFASADPIEEEFNRTSSFEGQFVPDDRFHNPRLLRPWAESVVAGIISYNTKEKKILGKGEGFLARYLWANYYSLLRRKMKYVAKKFSQKTGSRVSDVYVNGPLDEKMFAYRAGLGFRGKNGLLVNETHGSYVLIALFLTDAKLPISSVKDSQCGECLICIQNCPGGCLISANTEKPMFNRTRCLQEIMQKDALIPEDEKAKIDGMFFGCDECQEKCPFNESAPPSMHSPFKGKIGATIDMTAFLQNPGEFRNNYFFGSQLNAGWLKEEVLIRNALIVLANQKEIKGMIPAQKYKKSENQGLRDAAEFFLNTV
ncbi:DUF1730 domain-containing protein [candidate division WOR-3 bacterium]|nr:DUF1730 domain-containing protein [candidate division WOR-3 bacterium]